MVSLTANNHKTRSLARQLGFKAPTFDVLDLEAHVEEIVSLAVSYAGEGASLRARLLERASVLGREAEACLDFVRRLRGS